MVTHLINTILPSIENFRVAGYWIAFFAGLLETTLGIGLILPGSTIVLLLGALAARGYMDIGDLVWFSALGAFVGDNINYYLGKKYGAKWMENGFWLIKAVHMEKAKNFFDAHGAKSVFLGRFIPSGKELLPFIAGTVKMNRKKFMFWNVLGAIGWGFEYVLAGYIFARSLNLAEFWLSRAGIFVAFLLIFIAILYLLKWLLVRKGKQFLTFSVSFLQSLREAAIQNEHIRPWLQKHQPSLSFLKARFDTSVFSGLTLTILVLAFVYVLSLFAGVVEDLITSDSIIAADIRISNLFFALRTDTLTRVFTWITLLGKSQVILFFIVTTAALLWLWRKKFLILPLFIASCGSEAFTYLGKLVLHRSRPAMAIYAEHSFSFPSGHATIAVAFYGFVAYILMRLAQRWNTAVNIFFVAILLITAIGLSRVYLGVHYLSDVWSGYLVGAMWVIIAISFSEWLRHKEKGDQSQSPAERARPITFVLIIIATLFYAGFSLKYHPPLASVPEKKKVVISGVREIFLNEQMKFTETPFGKRQEPINFIFLARKDGPLIGALRQAGWTLTDEAKLSSFIRAVTALMKKTPHPSAPISPSFWNARIQDLSFAQVPGVNWLSNAHHLKIWRTNFLLKNGNNVYVGLVNANEGFKWGIIPKISPDLDTERERLYEDLYRTGKVESFRKVQLIEPLMGKNFIGDPFFSDGKAYVISLQ
jgi:membrane protein DedA with SNARE-associated domain/membrane-associated phospholipid phosphatase